MAETASDLGSARCFHPLGWRNSARSVGRPGGGGRHRIVCSHKYTKLAAYRLISIHDPSQFSSNASEAFVGASHAGEEATEGRV